MDFGGKYAGATRIGHGAAGTVYRARSVVFDRLVAIKVFHGTLDDERLQRDFQRECQVLGRLGGHPHIVAVHDSGITEDGRPYLVMAYYDLGSLPVDQRVDPAEAAGLVAAVADALQTAHEQGVLHRDVKPQNVLRSSTGGVALADFGISVRGPAELTSAAATASFAAPEVLQDQQAAGVASDVYGLAATLYHLLAGHPPHRPSTGETDLSYLQRVVGEPHLPLPADVPAALAAVVDAGLAKDPADRTASAKAFGDAVRAAVGQPLPTAAPTSGFGFASPAPVAPTSVPVAAPVPMPTPVAATAADPAPVGEPAPTPSSDVTSGTGALPRTPTEAAPAASAAAATAAAATAAAATTPATLTPASDEGRSRRTEQQPATPGRPGKATAGARPPVVSSPASVPAGRVPRRDGTTASSGFADPTDQDRPDAVTFASVTHRSARPVLAEADAVTRRRRPDRKLLAAVGAAVTTVAVVAVMLLVSGGGDASPTALSTVTPTATQAAQQMPTTTALPTPTGSATPTGPTASTTASAPVTVTVPATTTPPAPPRTTAKAPAKPPATTSKTTSKPYDANGVLLGVPRVSVDSKGIAVLTGTAQVNRSVTFHHLQIAVRDSEGNAVDPHGDAFDVAFTNDVTVTSSRTISGSRHYIGGPFKACMAYKLEGGSWINGPCTYFTAPS